MKFQVVLQWPASSVNEFDEMADIEDLLVQKLGAQNEVDGHDFGTEEANIFVHTDDPRRAFEQIQAVLSGHRVWPLARIAYRQLDGNEYNVLWPYGTTAFHIR
jgi:hypothetical protein